MGSQNSKKERIIKNLSSKDRDLVYYAYDQRKVIESFSIEEIERHCVIQKLSKNLERPEFRRVTIDLLKNISKRHYEGIVKYCIPKMMDMDIFKGPNVTRRLFSNADLVEDILILINSILLHHSSKLTQSQGTVLLGFLKHYIISPFPKFHFRRTQILCRVYVGLQCISAIAFPYSKLQEYSWGTLDVLLQSMNLMLIETVIFIQNGKFESLVLEYRGNKVNEVKGESACNCLFKLSRFVIDQFVKDQKKKIQSEKKDEEEVEEEDEGEEELELGLEGRKGISPAMKNKALVDWAVRSVIRIFENPSIFRVLRDVGWVESLVEIILVSGRGRPEYVIRGMDRICALVNHSPEFEFLIRRLFIQKGHKNLECIMDEYEKYSRMRNDVQLEYRAKRRRMKEIEKQLLVLVGKDEYEDWFRDGMWGMARRKGARYVECDCVVMCVLSRSEKKNNKE